MRQLLFAILALGCVQTYAAAAPPAEKILQVTVNETGTIFIGRDTVATNDLARYIQERLFKSYLGTGQMHSKINFISAQNTAATTIEEVLQEIHAGQQRALTEICLQKFKKRFDDIEEKQQAKLKKQFPVLFQSVTQESPGV